MAFSLWVHAAAIGPERSSKRESVSPTTRRAGMVACSANRGRDHHHRRASRLGRWLWRLAEQSRGAAMDDRNAEQLFF